MRFSCGENWKAREARLKEWHPFFCIWPRTIAVENGKDICAWFEWIERRRYFSTTLFCCGWITEYRAKRSAR
jgi:hypothetical protein